MHKYVEASHWFQLKENYERICSGERDAVMREGLKYEDNVNHTGEALLLFESFFLANEPEHLELRRRLCNEFLWGESLNGFETTDKQYLLDVAAASMRLHFWEASKDDVIHVAANSRVQTSNVNPLLTKLFQIETADRVSTRNSSDAEIAGWYSDNILRIANRTKNAHYKSLSVAAEEFNAGFVTNPNLQILQNAMGAKSVDAYSASFVISPSELEADAWAIPKKIEKFGELVSREIEHRKSERRIT